MSVQGRGLPGCSSHLKGTEAKVWSGGVEVPDGWSGECMAMVGAGRGKNGKLSVEKHGSVSSSSAMFACGCVGERERD